MPGKKTSFLLLMCADEQTYCFKGGGDVATIIAHRCTEMGKKVCPRFRYIPPRPEAGSHNLGQTFLPFLYMIILDFHHGAFRVGAFSRASRQVSGPGDVNGHFHLEALEVLRYVH